MKIFRRLFLLDKLFALTNQEFLSTHSRLALLNLLKCFELYNLNNGKHVNHWVNKAVNSILSLSKKFRLPQDMFSILDTNSPLSDTERYKLFEEAGGEKEKDILVGCIIKDFLNIGSSKESGQEAKYGHLYTNKNKVDTLIKNTTGKYSVYFRYIALCLSGQLAPEDWWTERGNIPRMQINYGLQHDLNNEEIKSTISQCILTVCGENDYFKWEEV